jgi:multidrug efflux system outer membrane protein
MRIASLGGMLLVLGGCTVGPNYKRPAVVTPVTYRGATPPGEGTPLGARKWNTVFTDPVLQALIAEALKNNYDVKIAADRVLEQEAQVGITKAAQYPTVSAGATFDALALPGGLLGGGSSSSSNGNGSSSVGVTQSNNGHTYITSGGFSATAAWNLDFWGYYRRQTEAARAQLRAYQWAQQVTFSTLVDNVASEYYQLRALDAELDVTKKTLEDRRQAVRLTTTLEQGGSGTLGDVRQAEQLFYTAEAQIPNIEEQIEQQENNLALLLGRSPGPIARGGAVAEVPHPVDVPVGLPSDLLERRPDILREEELLKQANANIGVARAQFFPTISLTGTGGTSSDALKGLVEQKNLYYYALNSLTQPVFEGGKLRSNLKLAKATDQELIDTYQQTIAGALRDVSNALAAYRKTREYRDEQEKLVAAASDSVRLAEMLYHAGATSFLEVLTNNQNLYSAQLALQTAEQQEALSLVQLYNALGGGW